MTKAVASCGALIALVLLISGCAEVPLTTVHIQTTRPGTARVVSEGSRKVQTFTLPGSMTIQPGKRYSLQIESPDGPLFAILEVKSNTKPRQYKLDLSSEVVKSVASGKTAGLASIGEMDIALDEDDLALAGGYPVTLQFPASETVDVESNTKRLRSLVAKVVRQLVLTEHQDKGSFLAITEPSANLAKGSTLLGFVAAEIENSVILRGQFQIVERERINDILAEMEKQRRLISDPATIAEVGKLANAKYLLLSNMFLLDGEVTLYARIVEVETAVAVSSASAVTTVSQ